MATKYYKVLAKGQKSCHGGDHIWIPGEWLEVQGDLVPCENGIHLCRIEQLINWLHEEIWEAECDESELIDHGDKVVVRKARIIKQCLKWNERTARLFACDCAQAVAHLNPDSRVQTCIDAARRYANGKLTDNKLNVARAAASAAARDAARAAASLAASLAAWDAPWAAAKNKQTEMLKKYLD